MKLISPSKAKRALPAARKRLANAKMEILNLCRAFRLTSGNVYEFSKDITKANAELVSAREWFGECFYMADPELVREDIENALRDARISQRDIRYNYSEFGMDGEDVLDYVVGTYADLRSSREKLYALLAEYAERWYQNG